MRTLPRPSIRDFTAGHVYESLAYYVKVVDTEGRVTDLKFAEYDKNRALTCAVSAINSADFTFVSIAKRLA